MSRWVLPFLLSSACVGVIDDPVGSPSDAYPDSPIVTPEQCESVPRAIEVPARRLTLAEYETALAQLFGDGMPDVSDLYPASLNGHVFSSQAGTSRVNELEAEAFLSAAERVAEHLVPSLPTCGGDVESCAREYLGPIAERAFRRPVDAADLDRLAGIARDAAADGLAGNEAIAVAIVSLLQEPRFLYAIDSRAESAWSIDGHERAQRLALTFWHELPDETLIERARSGGLDTSEGMATEAARVVEDERTRAAFHEFVREWLGVGELPESHDPAVRQALDGELSLLIDDAWDAEDGLDALLRADTVYADSVLEGFYGLPAASSGPGDYVRTTMPARVGLITHPLVLAAASHGEQSSAILRGKLIRTRLLCAELPPPPADAAALEPDLPPDATPRDRYEARIAQPLCAGCHVLMDPVGFALEGYDGLGRFRTDIGGRAVDDLGEIRAGGDATATFRGAGELADVLANSEAVSQCFARQFMRYALARPSGRDTICVENDLGTEFRNGGRSLKHLFESLASHPAFVERIGEVTP
jgi:hypothetical protein